MLADEALLQLRTDRVRFAPYGLAGGAPGGDRATSWRWQRAHDAAGQGDDPHRPGTLISHEQAGGGGYGDPLARDPEQVREDVADGKITAALRARRSTAWCSVRPASSTWRQRRGFVPHAAATNAMAVEMVTTATRKVTRNPEASRARILDAARDEFVPYGLSGARVDRIASAVRRQQEPDLSLFRLQGRALSRGARGHLCRPARTAARRDSARAAAGRRHASGWSQAPSIISSRHAGTDPPDERREHPFRPSI